MILHILMYIGLYLAFGLFIATPLFLWITKEPLDDHDGGAIILLSVAFPIFIVVSIFQPIYFILKRLCRWYFKFLQRLSR